MGTVQLSEVRGKRYHSRKWRMFVQLAIFALIVAVVAILSKESSPLQAAPKPSISLEQCANKGLTCDTSNPTRWVTGNLSTSNSQYAEGDSVPYRALLSNLTVGATYKIAIEWDSTVSGRHALDYLTSFNFSETTADPCAGVTCGAQSTLSIPLDPSVSAAMVSQQNNQSILVFGGTFPTTGAVVDNTGGSICGTTSCTISSNPSSYALSGTYGSTSQSTISVYVTATSRTVVLAWGGHIASRLDWGINKSASVINGSPYHMRITGFDCSSLSHCSVGQMDRSLSSAAVTLPSSITIVKQASVESSTSFDFWASPSPLSSFSLVDDGTVANTKVFSGITSFGTYTVTENAAMGWDFDRISCSIAHQSTGSTSINGATVSIVLAEGEDVVCTFFNRPTPAPALSLATSADHGSFLAAGTTITYGYLLTNTGNTILGPSQFYISDDRINEGELFPCGAANTTLAIGATVSCTAQYVTTSVNVTDESVTHHAFGVGGGVSTPTAILAIPFVAPGTTTTTTTVPTTTATIGVAEQPVVLPDAPTDAEDVFDVLFVEELPEAGLGVGLMSLIAGIVLLLGIGVTSMSVTRGNRRIKSGDNK